MKQHICEIEEKQFEWIKSQLKLGKFEIINEVVQTALTALMNEDKQQIIIPKDKMAEGIRLCRENAIMFLRCSELLVKTDSKNYSNYGIILFQYAKEEIGKMALLRKNTNQPSETVSIPNVTFSDHVNKDNIAEELLGKDSWIIKGGFDDSGFQIFNSFKGFEKPIRTNHKIRLKCAFVDYDEGQGKWILGVEHSSETLLAKIEEVKSKLN